MDQQKIKIFLADDHQVFREGIQALLEVEPMLEVVGGAGSGEVVLAMLDTLLIDVLLLDIDMPGKNGLEVIKVISRKYPTLKVLVFSSYDHNHYVQYMIKGGACGYILKSCTKDELILAIKTVHAGNQYFSRKISKKIFLAINKGKTPVTKTPFPSLTPREIEILKLVAKGHTNQEIGAILFISPRTVDTHRRNIMEKLDLHNAAALTKYAAQKGLLDLE